MEPNVFSATLALTAVMTTYHAVLRELPHNKSMSDRTYARTVPARTVRLAGTSC